MAEKSLGQIAFEAYRVSVGGVTYDGKSIPTWEQLSTTIQVAWNVAANAVMMHWEQTLRPG